MKAQSVCFLVGILGGWLNSGMLMFAGEEPVILSKNEDVFEIAEVNISGRIHKQELAVKLDFEVTVATGQSSMMLLQGPAVLDQLIRPKAMDQLTYDPNQAAYLLSVPRRGRYPVEAVFRVQAEKATDPAWHQACLLVPAGRYRRIHLVCEEAEMDVQLPDALQVQRSQEGEHWVIRAVLPPHQLLQVRWKPQVQLADAKLVLSSQANSIVDVRAGHLDLDTVFQFSVTQGKLEKLSFDVPENLRVTGVNGANIRNWELSEDTQVARKLHVILSRPQTENYTLHIRSETDMKALPATLTVPMITPTGGIRASGHVMVGTDSALQLVVLEATGLTQIDRSAFPRIAFSANGRRHLPQGKAFYYSHAGSQFGLRLTVDDIVPSFDAAERYTLFLKEDNLQMDAQVELDVRDAPLHHVDLLVPKTLAVASVEGSQIEDYHLSNDTDSEYGVRLRITFGEPVLGRTLVQLRLELGRSPLDQPQSIPAIHVVQAKTQRGYVVVAAETGILIEELEPRNLRSVHTASLPLRVPQAQFAYRFRQADWVLDLRCSRRPAGIRAEVFHLQSLGESLAYGSAVINYIITGAPVDELSFLLPEAFENIEFVGRDVRRWRQQGNRWRVTLNRKVIGDYNLAVTYTQQVGPKRPIHVGALHCSDVQTQTGYVAVTSHLDLNLHIENEDANNPSALLPIAMDELPGDYRLLTSSPILAAYKYVTEDHADLLYINAYQRSALLQVVLDMASHQTQLTRHPDGRVESVTTVQYKVKNTSGQFLSLTLPTDAHLWGVSLVETQADGTDQENRLAASYNQESGQLLVPLHRQINPNDPMTIKLEYGQIHSVQGWWRYRVDLHAPQATVPVTYADWQVSVSDAWALSCAGGNMDPPSTTVAPVGMAGLLRASGRLWKKAVPHWLERPALWIVAAFGLFILVWGILRHRKWVPEFVIFLFLGTTLWLGFEADRIGNLPRPVPTSSLTYTQAVHTDPEQVLQVRTCLTPAWRLYLTATDLIVWGTLLSIALGGGLRWRRFVGPAIATLIAGGLYLGTKVPMSWPVLELCLTWLVPLLALLAFGGTLSIKKLQRFRPPVNPVPALLVLLVALSVFCLAGCSGVNRKHRPLVDSSVLEVLECSLNAGVDSVEAHYRLTLNTAKATRLNLVDSSAVLISSSEPQRHVKLTVEKGFHVITLDRPGEYKVDVTFLFSLAPADMNKEWRFTLPTPVALTNHVTLTIPDANIWVQAPGAVQQRCIAGEQQTTIQSMFTPGQAARFIWRPRERQAAREAVRFYAQDMALAHVTPGLLQVTHALRLRIAQGQVDTLVVAIPKNETVTSVQGPWLGAWRFDPSTRQLEIRLSQPVTDLYSCTLTTQAAHASVPYEVRLAPLVLPEAAGQHSILGLAADPSVFVRVSDAPTTMNLQDYLREAAELVKAIPGLTPEQLTQAFRYENTNQGAKAEVLAVQSELRSRETGRFNVEDERLVYNSQWVVSIGKAGLFGMDLQIPDAYDIDTLTAEEISHWDESSKEDIRHVHVHFKKKLLGQMTLHLALSQPISQIPQQLTAPCVTLVGSLKHTGQLLVSAEQGVRVSVQTRQGLNEINPVELGHKEQNLLAFRLLRPDWQLDLDTELIQPRITAQTLHVVHVTDGLVRHRHTLRYRLFNAGIKTFTLEIPADAAGVTLSGAGIARREQVTPNQWRIELADKVYDRPYLMQVLYETRYEPSEGLVSLIPIRCHDVDMQQGHTVVFATDRVELSVAEQSDQLHSADARNIPKVFGAGDLSGAVVCLRGTSANHDLRLQATRHHAAHQVGADVEKTQLVTVVTEAGQTINQVHIDLQIKQQRHLQAQLPLGCTLWSLSVDGQAVQPSLRADTHGRENLLIPLPQQSEETVAIDLIYIGSLPKSTGFVWAGKQQLEGPRFDLPLKQINWQVYVPENYSYDDFNGTLAKIHGMKRAIRSYDLQSYEQQIRQLNAANMARAQQQQSLARELAEAGQQGAARRALAKGYNFSLGNRALNEDIRVDLDNLLHQQVKVGLMNARDRLRFQAEGQSLDPAKLSSPVFEEARFNQQDAERLESSLGQADSENLELITQRILRTQAAAQASVSQLQITLPIRGKLLQFASPLQVESLADMRIHFRAQRASWNRLNWDWGYGLAMLVCLLILGSLYPTLFARWRQWQAIYIHTWGCERKPTDSQPVDSPVPSNEGGVSAQDLLE